MTDCFKRKVRRADPHPSPLPKGRGRIIKENSIAPPPAPFPKRWRISRAEYILNLLQMVNVTSKVNTNKKRLVYSKRFLVYYSLI